MTRAVPPRGIAVLALAVAAMSAAVASSHTQPRSAHAQEILVVVTSAQDDPTSDEHECPSDTGCTLRRAIESANNDASGEPLRILFDQDVFPADVPAAIAVSGEPLPPLIRAGVTIDGRGAGVVVDGSQLAAGPAAIGLQLAGVSSSVYGMRIQVFSQACLVLSGADTEAGGPGSADRNVVDDCATGIEVTGASARVLGNLVGLSPVDPMALLMATGIAANASGVIVGPTPPGGPANFVGNVSTGVLVGHGSLAPVNGVVVRANRIGAGPGGQAAPVGTGILISHPANGTLAANNELVNAGTGIGVADNAIGAASSGNTFTRNTFRDLAGLAIDLRADGVAEPNDPGDSDSGPNNLLNWPVVTSATQGLIQGTACDGCLVSFYATDHVPGAALDRPTVPLAALETTAGPTGQFQLASPPVVPGDWLVATATDPDGNTSEFSPAVRVGAGLVQCGASLLAPGWNLVGFFGESRLLGGAFPPPDILAVHQLLDGSDTAYASWFSNGQAGLSVLQTGEAYWFYAEAGTLVPGAVSLSSGLPVPLAEGWNEFVYVGGNGDVRDALRSLGGQWDALYRYTNSGASVGWESYGDESLPGYAHGFTTIDPCTAYRIRMTAPATLVPLQP